MKKISKLACSIFAITVIVMMGCLLAACGSQTSIKLYDGETVVKSVNVEKDKTYNFGALKKVGYTFLGWYSENQGGQPLTDANGDSAGMVWKEENKAAYAHWSANQYELTLDYCDATSSQTVKKIDVTYDARITDKLPVPSKTGFSFVGWFTAANGGKQITDANSSFLADADIFTDKVYDLENLTLYARWGDKIITYQFVTNIEDTLATVQYKAGTVLKGLGKATNYLPTLIKDNHCFVGWYFDANFVQPMTFPYTIPDHADTFTTLYAKFEAGSIGVNEVDYTTVPGSGDKEYQASYTYNTKTKIVVPDTYYGKPVTRINSVLSTNLKEVILPQTVISFSNNAFSGCSVLESINIPFGITSLPKNCFADCEKLNNITIPSDLTLIDDGAFSGCASIEQLVLPNALTTLGKGVFRNMSSLTAIVVPESNDRYLTEDGVLYQKTGNALSLIQYPAAKTGATFTINAATNKILQYAFSSSKISSIIIGGKISTLETGVFENCSNLMNVKIDSTATNFSIGSESFKNCSKLKALIISYNSKVPTLQDKNAFNNVSSTFSIYVISDLLNNYKTATNWRLLTDKLYTMDTIVGNFAVDINNNNTCTIRQYFGTDTEVEIPGALKSKPVVGIAENSFSYSELTTVAIPSTVTNIAKSAFTNCQNLESIYLSSPTPPTLGNNVFDNIADGFGIYIKGSGDVVNAYKAAAGWSAYASHIWTAQ